MDKDRRALFGAGLASASGIALAQSAETGQRASPPRQTPAERASALPASSRPLDPPARPARPSAGAESLAETTLQPPGMTIKRSPEHERAWGQVKALVEKELLPDAGKGSLAPLTARLKRIDSGFKFTAQKADDDFSPFHVEPLVDQAADLLDRGLRDRGSWDELGSKWATLCLELAEFSQLDAVHQREEAAGVYEVPRLQSFSDLKAEQATQSGYQRAHYTLNSMVASEFSYEQQNKLFSAAQLAGCLSGLVPYSFGDADFNGYTSHTWNGESKVAYEHYKYAAAVQSWSSVAREEAYAQAQVATTRATADSARRRTEGLQAKFDWDDKNATFQRERTLVARQLQEIKARLATDPDGLLNHAKRLDSLRTRFQADFRDALARLKVVQEGLRNLYGFSEPLPSNEASPTYFDDALLWCRKAIQFLVRFSRQEQSVVFPLSIRQLLGHDRWERGFQGGTWEFDVPATRFEGMRAVRIRGISATADAIGVSDDSRIWQLAIAPPSQASYVGVDGTTVTLDQRRVPEARLLRVGERKSPRDPDVVGVASWFNISPVGRWKVRVLGAIPQANSLNILKDICIELVVVYRAGGGR